VIFHMKTMKSENRGRYITASTKRKHYDISLCSLRKWTKKGRFRACECRMGSVCSLRKTSTPFSGEVQNAIPTEVQDRVRIVVSSMGMG
jgi:hypothetical protein